MKTATVYGLYDPRTPDVICYVGVTTRPLAERLSQHYAWAKKLQARILENCSFSQRFTRERYWIQFWQERNPNLKNKNVIWLTTRDRIFARSKMHLATLYFSKPQWPALKRLAKQKGITTSELVRRIVNEELERAA